ncbi:hypothetical protein [Bordetella genomosp. 13]|uniref:hypothetical protein n=1 Tax=Bordetella genomosp. 13 TaxID=463040 RepID=UPI0011A3DC8E|nr:hypothetical protein [Bordetella genomosp. 13]
MRLIDIPIMATPEIDVHEFCAALGSYMKSDAPVIVTRCGKPAGYFIPVLQQPDQAQQKQGDEDQAFAYLLDDREIEEVVAEFEALRRQGHANDEPRG